LGGANRASLTSFGAKVGGTITGGVEAYQAVSTGTTKSMENGDLILNGVAVGASLKTDDQLSTDFKDASAISKAAAINRVSDQTGVHATVGTTTAFGTTMEEPAANSSGTMKINGWETAAVTLGTDKEVNRLLVANAINALSKQTGVVALNTHDDVQGVVLQAADGRNISVDFGTSTSPAVSLTSAATGLSATGTFVGTYELSTKDNSPITVSSQTDKVVQNSGLAFGTFSANTASMTSMQRASAVAGIAPGSTGGASDSTTGVLNGNTLVINGVGIDAAIGADDASSNNFATSSTKASSAIAIAAAINKKSDLTGVTATAEPNVLRGTGFTAGTLTGLNINGVEVAINTDTNSNRDDVLTAINKFSGQTGVVASAWGSGMQLTAEDGRNISIAATGTGDSVENAKALGLTGVAIGDGTSGGTLADEPVTHFAQVTLHSEKEFELKSGSEVKTNVALLGFRKGTYGGTDNGAKVADLDISTQAGATAALKTLDSAIGEVSTMQSRAGAYQNRLDAVVNNLSTSNQNMSASRSRILDTDYATETTNLAKSQIISQAATAMLAQANQSAQGVMSLLR
jgi:flagellin